ncbi:response regulator transcription factor [Clostridium beijerinckii]|uniref:Stage 0 sporulation protein A homolog n=2 Tax=Clostridium beijerinckii TaxID=1520 RepID=A0AAE2RUP1_CLOBE|nr:response regulator transcription factor [Clostridium beijerinckii]ABR35092.1 two component transcriptional regulator, winged helix family [Clostridium beijerinckii NCIMB 8052]AIU03752.1 two component transcriptional regulator [Clostridium beijerinckii ATCC 35702]MBF7810277.1 response regulator transcription factor [Clostridium beijerinckii]NRT23521.1 DNA-binding response OmpR family regulator [Clostridium beijerinckii]NRT68906.1 DNA-binding response OmpR family regulator [Clostridium beijer
MNNKFKILVVDDEQNILDVIKAYLEKDGFDVITAMDGKSALDIYSNENIHLIVLDLMLPKMTGEEVCNRIRAVSSVPIIMLTAKAEEDEKIEGISMGADDYLTKPFSVRELVVRVRALLRRAYRDFSPMADILTFNNGDLEVDIKKMVVKKQGVVVNLTTNEFKILTVFLSNPTQVFSREKLVEKAFGANYEGFDRTVDSYIKNIRQKIESNHKEPTYITTVYGMGYKFIPSNGEVKK